MSPPSGIKAAFFVFSLLAVASPSPAEDGEFSPGRRYVVETEDGGVFSSEISDADGDSLYFVDGSAIPRAEVAAVHGHGEAAEQGTLHPGPETQPSGSTLKVGTSTALILMEAIVHLLVAVFD